MAESKHDDLADALARMAAGDGAPSEHEPAAPVMEPAPPALAPARAVRPASTRPTAPRPAAAVPRPPQPSKPPVPAITPRSPAVPAVAVPPRVARPAAPVLGASSPPVPQPPVLRPVAPALSSKGGGARPQRPAAPTLRSAMVVPADVEVDGGQSTGLSSEQTIIDDDDAVIMPAPEASVFATRSKTSAEARAKVAQHKNLEFRRTLIPVLLTSGVLMLIFSSLKFVSGSDSSLAALPIWVPTLLLAGGVILLGLAAANMAGVKHQLEHMDR